MCFVFLCFVGWLSASTAISGNITASATWDLAGSPYILTGNVTVSGSALPVITIDAGVTVLFNTGAALIIGHGSSASYAGGLVVNGNSEYPVVFSSNQAVPAPGDWSYVRTLACCLAGQLSFNYAIFEYGGSSTALFEVNGSSPTLNNCIFRNSAGMGINHSAITSSASIQNCAFQNNASYPLRWNPDKVDQIGEGNTFSGNGSERILLRNTTLSIGTTWHNTGIPYEMEDSFNIQNDVTPLIIEPGVFVLFREGDSMNIGHGSSSAYDGCVQAAGAFFSAVDPAARWNGIKVDASIQPTSFNDCSFQYMNSTEYGGVYCRSTTQPVIFEMCEFVNIDNYAFWANENTLFEIRGCIFNNCRNTISVYPNDMSKLKAQNSYMMNTDNRIHCQAGNINVSSTWTRQSMPIFVLGNITTNGNTLPETIIPYGTILEFNANTSFAVGHTSSASYRASLRATGVTFRGAVQTSGHWTGLIFNYHSNPSILNGCVVRDAGYNNAAAVNIITQTCTITGCYIYNNYAKGVNMGNDCVAALSGNMITACGSYPLSLDANAVRVIGEGNSFSGNAVDMIEVRAETITTSGTWRDPGVPYYLTGSISINSATPYPHIQIMPGNEILLPQGAILSVGFPSSTSYRGSLAATETTFTRSSAADTPYGIVFNPYIVSANCVFTNCTFSYMQHNTQNTALYINGASPLFEECLFTNNGGSAIVATNSARPVVNNCTFTNNGDYPIRTTAAVFDAVSGVGNSFSGNNPDRILISGGTLDQNYVWDNPSVPVEVSSNILVYGISYPVLTINSGLTLLFQGGTGMTIGYGSSTSYRGVLHAEGATFSALSGAPGGWEGITFARYLADGSYLRGCVVQYGGSNGNIYLNNSPMPIIESCIIRWGEIGIKASGSQVNTSIIKNYILANSTGIYCMNSANPVIGGTLGSANSIVGNTSWGVQNAGTNTINAEWNWWGDEAGPFLRYGDNVSANVDFDPWRTTDIGDAPGRFELLSPATGTVLESLDPILDWEEAIDPSPGDTVLYTLQICTSSEFLTDVTTIPDLSGTVYHVPEGTLADDNRYYWRVSATDTQGQTTWCYQPWLYFDIAVPQAPGAFQLLAPADQGTVYLTSPLLSWETAVDPDPGDLVEYIIHYSLTAGFDEEELINSYPTSAFCGFCAPGEIIYWKVEARDLTNRSTFSQTHRFFVDPDARPRAPFYFTLTPIGNDMLIQWEDVPGADSYIVRFCDTPYGGFYPIGNPTAPSYLHTGGALYDEGFYHVVADDYQ